jgi:hypothetical protein
MVRILRAAPRQGVDSVPERVLGLAPLMMHQIIQFATEKTFTESETTTQRAYTIKA